ncbi:MAG: hypothetical protein IJY89_04480, partial [Clostridia bacterium]|nr:hypothetical protein [Clostridia bacterium]
MSGANYLISPASAPTLALARTSSGIVLQAIGAGVEENQQKRRTDMKVYIKSILFVLVVMLLSAPLSGVLSSAIQSTPPPSPPHPEVRFKFNWTPEEFQNVLKGNYDKYADKPELYKLYSLMNQQGCPVPENLLTDFERIANTHQQGVYPVIYVTSDHYTGKLVE